MSGRARLLLTVVVAVQAVLLASVLVAATALSSVADLEAAPPVMVKSASITRADLVDALHVFSGTPDLGLDDTATPFRRWLAYDPGHFSWMMLEDRPKPSDGLFRLAARRMDPDEHATFRATADDGLLNLFYDLGSREDVFNHNWTAVGVEELQTSPLLPWTKKIDFIVLSGYDADHASGLRYILRGNPAFPVFGPPLGPPGRPRPAQPGDPGVAQADLRAMERLLPLPMGLFALTPRLRAFTYRSLHPTEEWNAFQTALVVRGAQGWTVVAGSDGLPPPVLVERVEQASGERVAAFVGATGYRQASEDAGLEKSLHTFHQAHPDLEMIPTYATSATAHSVIQRIFGPQHYRAGLLGTRISL